MKYFHLLCVVEMFWPLRTVLSFAGNSKQKPWCQQQHQHLVNPRRSIQRSITTHTQLYAAKMVYKWRVLPSGSLTGICDDGIITTSTLQEPASAKPNAVVTTASGSQYKLVGDSVGGKSNFEATPSIAENSTSSGDTALTTISVVALVVISGIFAVVVLQKFGFVGSSSLSIESEDISSIYDLSGRTVALILYSIGITIAMIQLLNDANKLSKN